MSSTWLKRPALWFEEQTAFISVAFTWDLPKVFSQAIGLKAEGWKVVAGGPAMKLRPDLLLDVVELSESDDTALARHNSNATFTSRGCPNKCPFCAVPKIEGDLIELNDWEPKPIVCDNNLLACSRSHFDKVIDRLKGIKGVDFNQGLDARLLSAHHIDRFKELNLAMLRFSWDYIGEERQVKESIDAVLAAGFPSSKITCFALIGFDDNPDDALYRLETIKSWGIWPFAMRYQPLDALSKDSYVAPTWTRRQLKDYMRYWNRQIWLGHVSFWDYLNGARVSSNHAEPNDNP